MTDPNETKVRDAHPGLVGLPEQTTEFDLSRHSRDSDNRPAQTCTKKEALTPHEIMQSWGFKPTSMTPLQFLVAVMNNELDKIFEEGKRLSTYKKRGGIALSYRIEAAKAAAPFMHPKLIYTKSDDGSDTAFGDALIDAVSKGNKRLQIRETILEVVDQIGTDLPLPEANYPEAFSPRIKSRPDDIIQESGHEGDTEYNPDNE